MGCVMQGIGMGETHTINHENAKNGSKNSGKKNSGFLCTGNLAGYCCGLGLRLIFHILNTP